MMKLYQVLLFVWVAVVAVTLSDAAHQQRSVSLEKYVNGRWLVRSVHPENWVQPYTHEALFRASTMFDGELTIDVQPFYGVDVATGMMASFTKTVGDAVGPVFYRVVGEVMSMVAMATGTPPNVVAARMNASDDESSFSSWARCAGDDQITERIQARLRNVSFNVRLNMESSVNGVTSFSWLQDADASSDDAPLLQFPVTLHHAPTDFQKYRTITTAAQDSATDSAPIKCLSLPLAAHEKEEDGAREATPPLALWSFSAHVLDDSNILVHVVTAARLTCGGGSREDIGDKVLCPVTFVFKRTSQSNENRELWSTVGTIGLLVVVAFAKFAPRQYMKWKGISPNVLANVAARGKGSELLKHAEILRAAKKQR